jgi:hypothetical protein
MFESDLRHAQELAVASKQSLISLLFPHGLQWRLWSSITTSLEATSQYLVGFFLASSYASFHPSHNVHRAIQKWTMVSKTSARNVGQPILNQLVAFGFLLNVVPVKEVFES